jgi:hypothetical protein
METKHSSVKSGLSPELPLVFPTLQAGTHLSPPALTLAEITALSEELLPMRPLTDEEMERRRRSKGSVPFSL